MICFHFHSFPKKLWSLFIFFVNTFSLPCLKFSLNFEIPYFPTDLPLSHPPFISPLPFSRSLPTSPSPFSSHLIRRNCWVALTVQPMFSIQFLSWFEFKKAKKKKKKSQETMDFKNRMGGMCIYFGTVNSE